MASAMNLSLLLLCFLLLTQVSNSYGQYHTSYTPGTRRFLLRTSDDSGVSPSARACSSIPSGNNGNKLPVVHRLSPCNPLGGTRKKQHKPSLDDMLHRDGHRMRYLSEVHSGAASAPSAVPTSGITFPDTQNVISGVPGVFDYTIIAGYGTPAQQVPVYFDNNGMSYLRCKPCLAGPGGVPCDLAFDPSMSSSFYSVPCGSPECRSKSCSVGSGGKCTFTLQNTTFVFGNGTFVKDTLTLSPGATFENFTFGCMQFARVFNDAVVGEISLSRSSLSLASRVLLSSPPGTAAFSYCLPPDTGSHGFLSISPALSEYTGRRGVKYVPLVTNPMGPNFYFVDLVGISVDGTDLPIPPAVFTGNGTLIDVQTSFSYLNPPIYAAFRDEVRRRMAQYTPAPPFRGLDTCYNFTGVSVIYLPDIKLRFGNGESMDLDDRQFMYFFREHLDEGFPFGCLAFAASPDEMFPWNILGSLVQRTREVVYDVRGGKVGFVPESC